VISPCIYLPITSKLTSRLDFPLKISSVSWHIHPKCSQSNFWQSYLRLCQSLLFRIVVCLILWQQILKAITVGLAAAYKICESIKLSDVGDIAKSRPKLLEVAFKFSSDFHFHACRDKITCVCKPYMETNLLYFPEAPLFNKLKAASKAQSGMSYFPILIRLRICSRYLVEGVCFRSKVCNFCWLVSIFNDYIMKIIIEQGLYLICLALKHEVNIHSTQTLL